MWNMPRKGFEELYEKIPGPKPSFEEIWRLTGGNPSVFHSYTKLIGMLIAFWISLLRVRAFQETL
jgi:hypothetical protein